MSLVVFETGVAKNSSTRRALACQRTERFESLEQTNGRAMGERCNRACCIVSLRETKAPAAQGGEFPRRGVVLTDFPVRSRLRSTQVSFCVGRCCWLR